MGHRVKQVEADEAEGAPEWMVTFSDCMTLLLTFFVLLLSFSSFDENLFQRLSVIFCKAMPLASQVASKNKEAFFYAEQIEPTEELGQGSEKPTLSKGGEDNLKRETDPADFRSRKVFWGPSKMVFWGKGTTISPGGRDVMTAMASFLKEVPSRIVISENDSDAPIGFEGRLGGGEDVIGEQTDIGLQRAWAVVEYLTTKHGLDKGRFSISARSTIRRSNHESRGTSHELRSGERRLEIVLLEWSIYN